MARTALRLAALAVFVLPFALRAQTLRYAGEAGERARYRLTNTVRIHQEAQGVPAEMTVRSFSLLDVVLESVSGDTLTFAVSFDSLDLAFGGADVPSPDLSAIAGRRMTLRLSPRGEVHGFDVPPEMGAAAGGFDLKQMVSHFFPRLPAGTAGEGTTWTDTLALPVSQQGVESRVEVITTYTSRGEARTPEGSFLEVGYGTATTLSGAGEQNGTPVRLEGAGSGSGTILFGGGGSTFWSSRGAQTLELEVEFQPPGQAPVTIPIRQEIASETQHL